MDKGIIRNAPLFVSNRKEEFNALKTLCLVAVFIAVACGTGATPSGTAVTIILLPLLQRRRQERHWYATKAIAVISSSVKLCFCKVAVHMNNLLVVHLSDGFLTLSGHLQDTGTYALPHVLVACMFWESHLCLGDPQLPSVRVACGVLLFCCCWGRDGGGGGVCLDKPMITEL